MSSKKNEIKSINIRSLIFFVLFIILFIVSGVKILYYIKDSNKIKKIFADIKRNVVVYEGSNENIEENSRYKIDFKNLKNKNTDTVGFLKVNGTDIENVVVKSTNNTYYLSHDFEKQENKAGWIFSDYRNKLDGTDKNIIIYGHNMQNGTMFSSLKNILNSNWKDNEENHFIIFITENGNNIYEVFSVYQIENEDYYMKTDFNGKEFNTFINTIKKRSKYYFNPDVGDNDKILTLSTCGNNNERIVLHAKKIIK